MTSSDRQQWILAYMQALQREANSCVFVLRPVACITNQSFVDDYIDTTGVPYQLMMYGAHKCPSLGRDLSAMYKAGKLVRKRMILPPGSLAMGFPTWVYHYELAPGKSSPKP